MPNSFTDKKLAAAAGRKSRPKRSLEWEALGKDIAGKHTDRFNNLLNGLDDEEFAKQFLNVLNYFKPKLASTNNKTDLSGKVSIEPIEWSPDEG